MLWFKTVIGLFRAQLGALDYLIKLYPKRDKFCKIVCRLREKNRGRYRLNACLNTVLAEVSASLPVICFICWSPS